MSWHRNRRVLGAGVDNNIRNNVARVIIDGRTSRSLWAAGREEQRLRRAGSLRAISSAGKSSRTTAPTLQPREKNHRPAPSKTNIITVPSRRGKNICRPVPQGEKCLPSRSAEGKNIHRPAPPRGKTIPSRPAEEKNNNRTVPPEKKTITAPRGKKMTVPSRPGKKYSPSRPAEGKKNAVPSRRGKK